VTITIRVPGTPQPQGSKTKTRWGGMRDANSERLIPWRNAVTVAVVQAIGHHWQPLDGPLSVKATFTMPKPASAPKRTRAGHARSPTSTRSSRACFDGITDGGLWIDDARVVHVEAWKLYAGDPGATPTPGAVFEIRLIDAEETAA
jgi:Holliday junction resolvase RusA-like endonuclease